MIPEELLLSFFKNATSTLLHLKGNEAIQEHDSNCTVLDPLAASRQYVLNVQQIALKESIEDFQKQERRPENDSQAVTTTEFQDCLGLLGKGVKTSPEVHAAMEWMNEAARLALCKLVLYWEQDIATRGQFSKQRYLLDSPTEQGLERTRLLEYFGLCQAALKLHSVKKFMVCGKVLFDDLPSPVILAQESLPIEDTKLLSPQTRLEYIQQLLAKAMGWDPVFLTKELQKIFVEKDDAMALVHDQEVSNIFQELVQQMQIAIRTAFVQVQQEQQVKLLSDLEKGGNTRVVSVQYSEFEMTPDGRKLTSDGISAVTEAPWASTMEHTSEEERKRQIRLASEAAVLQQEILGELLRLPEHERNNRLEEAERVSQEFTTQVMTLPPGPDRIAFLQSVDPLTSRQLAMHKLWKGMLQANGGKAPQMASKCKH
jgi:hypothetical protein